MNLGTFGYRTCVYGATFVQQLGSVRTHAMNDDRPGSPDASSEVSITVFIPERTRVFPFRNLCHMSERCPRAFRIFCTGHEQAFVGCTEEYKELTVVITDSRCPRTSGITLILFPFREVKTVVKLSDQLPVYHIL